MKPWSHAVKVAEVSEKTLAESGAEEEKRDLMWLESKPNWGGDQYLLKRKECLRPCRSIGLVGIS